MTGKREDSVFLPSPSLRPSHHPPRLNDGQQGMCQTSHHYALTVPSFKHVESSLQKTLRKEKVISINNNHDTYVIFLCVEVLDSHELCVCNEARLFMNLSREFKNAISSSLYETPCRESCTYMHQNGKMPSTMIPCKPVL